MGSGTFSSDPVPAFTRLACGVRQRYGVVLLLLKETGRRRSYVAGDTSAVEPLSAPHLIPLCGPWTVAVYGWDRLSPEAQANLADDLRGFAAHDDGQR